MSGALTVMSLSLQEAVLPVAARRHLPPPQVPLRQHQEEGGGEPPAEGRQVPRPVQPGHTEGAAAKDRQLPHHQEQPGGTGQGGQRGGSCTGVYWVTY